eukprot:evm.model.scf_105.12 EVM.evm.TU.scf_105.12   scf_105:109056-110601(-)
MLPPVDPVAAGVRRCPFLHSLASAEGDAFARSVALNPFAPAPAACAQPPARRPVFEELEDFSRTFRLFHGPDGMVPLGNGKVERGIAAAAVGAERAEGEGERRARAAPRPAALGMGARAASMSASNFGFMVRGREAFRGGRVGFDPWSEVTCVALGSRVGGRPGLGFGLDVCGVAGRRAKETDQQLTLTICWRRRCFGERNLGDLFGNNNRKPRNSGGGGGDKSGQQRKPDGGQRPSPKARGGGPVHISASSTGAIAPGGQCPMRKIIGPLSALLIKGKCPPPIVKMRAALNRTQLVASLRPQDLPVKVLAVAVTSAVLNIPLGALRDHCRKFSPEWFLAVHATIPFVAMFRKAVLMPKYAMAITIAAAIGGQLVGARLERRRIKMRANEQLMAGDALAQVAPLGTGQADRLSSGQALASPKMACAQEAYVTESGEVGMLAATAAQSAILL